MAGGGGGGGIDHIFISSNSATAADSGWFKWNARLTRLAFLLRWWSNRAKEAAREE